MLSRKTSRLTVRDLVLVGVLSSLIIFIEMFASLLLMPLMTFVFIVGAGFMAFLSAPVSLLMIFKVNKPGVLLLSAVVRSVFYTLMGWPLMLVVMVAAALLGEWILSSPGAYRDIRRNVLAFLAYTAVYSMHGVILLWIMGYELFLKHSNYTSEQMQIFCSYYTTPVFIFVILGFNVVGALAGCWFGWRMLQKHFIKSGLIFVPVKGGAL